MNYVFVGAVCMLIGWLDPIVIWRKLNELGEKGPFPKAEEWRNNWRKGQSDPTPVVSKDATIEKEEEE